MDTQLSSAVEQHIDQYGLESILEIVAIICHEKSDHIRANWQDEKLARAWEKNGDRIDRVRVTPIA